MGNSGNEWAGRRRVNPGDEWVDRRRVNPADEWAGRRRVNPGDEWAGRRRVNPGDEWVGRPMVNTGNEWVGRHTVDTGAGGGQTTQGRHGGRHRRNGVGATSSAPLARPRRGRPKAVVVDGIRKTFGSVVAVQDISFDIGRGEVLGLLGPNGAGKTTMVDILSTLTRPDRGRAAVAGHDILSDPAGVRRSIMLTGQHVALDDMLTGRENLVMFGRLQGLNKSAARSRAEELLDQFDLVDAADRSVRTYSGGMRRRIDIACGLVVRPEVVFLDEPTTGLDPRSRQSIWGMVSDFKHAGITTLLTTQYLEEADMLSDRIIVIDHGRIVAEGTADELKERAGATYCEIVPRHLRDLPAMAQALGPLLPQKNRAALTAASDRISMPAPNGPNTLLQAVGRLAAANIELLDIALRRPSLDEVFLALTTEKMAPTTVRRTDWEVFS
jgi:ABC-2 type transport system ATP-binding protein